LLKILFCLQVINEDEASDGYDYKVDRKSLFRLVAKLQKVKVIKLFKAVVQSAVSTKSLTFVCTNDTERGIFATVLQTFPLTNDILQTTH
jgi:hypothetical protein